MSKASASAAATGLPEVVRRHNESELDYLMRLHEVLYDIACANPDSDDTLTIKTGEIRGEIANLRPTSFSELRRKAKFSTREYTEPVPDEGFDASNPGLAYSILHDVLALPRTMRRAPDGGLTVPFDSVDQLLELQALVECAFMAASALTRDETRALQAVLDRVSQGMKALAQTMSGDAADEDDDAEGDAP